MADHSQYPDLVARVKAAFLDGVLLVVMMISFGIVLDKLNIITPNVRKVGFIFIFFLYDPLMTSLFGGTLGHLMNGLRVRKVDDESKLINPLSATIRYVVKVILGWISFFFITSNEKGMAIHDLAARSVVIIAKKQGSSTNQDVLDQDV